MKQQNSAILSIGSNSGDRKELITRCIAEIHSKVATVVRVSALYESPAWGFNGAPFYNCALLVHTYATAENLLQQLLDIETTLGRTRTGAEGYQSRTIDIDLIAFNEEIIRSEKLEVPHPRMQDRMFVLLPMRDLKLDWRHPVLQQYLPEIVRASEDKSICKLVGKLDNPLDAVKPDSFNYIAIEGNIGAGKTTLTNKIAEDFNAKTVLERFADNPFLPKFYEDQPRYAFPLEMSFLADRYQQIADDLAQFDLFKDFIVADYHIFKSLIFAKVTLSEDEYRLYRKLFEIIYKEMPRPDLYVYLYQNTERLLENIRLRGRDYEQNIPAEYLEKINHGYLDYIKSQTDLNVLVIDVSDRDFVKNHEDYIFILQEIQQRVTQR
ncbi:MAG: 2-amino-4-hydroxy-6-hydroxymethyldihydropteridine diphosphokinase [Flavobacterium sp.]|nr:MAG: 2-amino-4-hydroxy-6-hydroxymethyldihydropteridine diphosphokinase [Flavobacterium sp.]